MESAVTIGFVLGRGGRVGSVGRSGTLNEEVVVALVAADVETGLPAGGASLPPQLPLLIMLCTSWLAPLPDPCSSRSLNSISSSSREVAGTALAPLGSSRVPLAPPGRESRLGSVKLSKSDSRDG